MSTRSIIAKENPDGSFKAIYCHWSGEPEHNGSILVHHYSDERKINQLLRLGDLSLLGPEIGEKHNFDEPPMLWCTAYGRDRGELNTRAGKYRTLEQVFDLQLGQDYVYVWRRSKHGISHGRWACYTSKGKPISLDGVKCLVYEK